MKTASSAPNTSDAVRLHGVAAPWEEGSGIPRILVNVPDNEWIDFVVDKIAEYRERAQEMRSAIESCVTAEDYPRFWSDWVSAPLNCPRSNANSWMVSRLLPRTIPGVPKVSGLWISARSVEKRYVFSGQPFQRFLYKEFVKGWKRASK